MAKVELMKNPGGVTKSTQPEYDQNEEEDFFENMIKNKELEALLLDDSPLLDTCFD